MGAGGMSRYFKMAKNVKSLIIFARDCSYIAKQTIVFSSDDCRIEIFYLLYTLVALSTEVRLFLEDTENPLRSSSWVLWKFKHDCNFFPQSKFEFEKENTGWAVSLI
jgi:hypothetical protein